MQIRDATPADAEDIRELHRRSIRQLGTQAYTREQVEAWAKGCESADYRGAIAAEDVEFVVADDGARIIGFGSLGLGSPDDYAAAVDAEITGVYVRPSATRDRVGTRLCAELERRAEAHDAQVVGLSASLNAVSFYRALGYERVRTYTHEFSSHESTGVTGDVVEMKKEL